MPSGNQKASGIQKGVGSAAETSAQLAAAVAKAITFTECRVAYIKAHRAGWKNAKHIAQWENTLTTYCEPIFGHLGVQDVDTEVAALFQTRNGA